MESLQLDGAAGSELLLRFAIALGAGLLIGLERGWQKRGEPSGSRVAGIRTFGLIGLSGGLAAYLGASEGGIVLAAAFLGLALLLGIGYRRRLKTSGDLGVTTEVAAVCTFALGAAAGIGELEGAAAGAVVVTLLLGVKPELHEMLKRLEQRELLAVVKLLLISVVLLPVLPDQGYGPWQALNPYRIWWMVVLIAGLSSLGYFAIKMLGTQRGVLLTGTLGGFASSTSTVLALARRGQQNAAERSLLAAAALLACTMTYLRILAILFVVAPSLAQAGIPALLSATLGTGAVAYAAFRRKRVENAVLEEIPSGNPFELRIALQFGALLAAIMVASAALQEWAGATGLFALAAVSGLADVDAITLSISTMADGGSVAVKVAMFVILLAAAVNNMVKAGLALAICRPSYGYWVAAGLAAGLLSGGIAALLTLDGTLLSGD